MRDNYAYNVRKLLFLYFCSCGGHDRFPREIELISFCRFDHFSVVRAGIGSEMFYSEVAVLGPQTPFRWWYRRLSSRVKVLRHDGHAFDLPRLFPFSHALR